MSKVIRYMIADYLGIGDTPVYSLMGTGFNTLDENPSAKVDKKAYVSDKSASGVITGYENVFPFDTDFISDDTAVAALYAVGRDQKTGSNAEFYYVRADLYGTAVDGAYPARKFKVACEVSSIAGAGTEIVKVTGNLHQVGDFVEGMFNTSTKAFTANA